VKVSYNIQCISFKKVVKHPSEAAFFYLAQGAFWGLMVGLVVGTVRMVMEFVFGTPSCGEKDLRPALLKDVHYLYFALILLALTALIITAVSLCAAPIPEQHVTINCKHI